MTVVSCVPVSTRRSFTIPAVGESRLSSSGVEVTFDKREGGDPPSRKIIAKNIISSLISSAVGYTVPGFPDGAMFDPVKINVPGFNTIFIAAGFPGCPRGDLTCGETSAGTCNLATGICSCNAGFKLQDGKCLGIFTFPPPVKGWTSDQYCQAIERAAKAKTICTPDSATGTVSAFFSSLVIRQSAPSIQTISANLATDLVFRSYVKLPNIKVPGFKDIYEAAKLMAPDADDFPVEGCGNTKVKQILTKIVGGQLVTQGAYPWMVYLELGCGGALINNKYILSAAHCIPEPNITVTAVIGVTKFGKDDAEIIEIPASSIIVHPNYNRSGGPGENDIALLRLPDAVSFTDRISPVCLPPVESFPTTSTQVYSIAGWGSTETVAIGEAGSGASFDMKVISPPVVSPSECFSTYLNGVFPLSESQICAIFKNGGQGDCQGDSGGPLFTYLDEMEKFTQVGIVSFGFGCGLADEPSVYARVSSFLDWIVTNTK